LASQFSLGTDQYPKSITQANNVLSNHPLDNEGKRQARASSDTDTTVNPTSNRTTTSSEEAPDMSFAQLEGKCYCCGKQGHKSPDCYHKNKPKSEWHITKVAAAEQHQSHLNVQNSSSDSASVAGHVAASQSQGSVTAPTSTIGWSPCSGGKADLPHMGHMWNRKRNGGSISVFS
jgi:hypothetical protein